VLAWSQGEDYAIHLFDVPKGKELRQLKGHHQWICNLAFSPDSKTLASAGADSTVRIWEVITGKQFLPAPNDPSIIESIALSADDSILVSGGLGGKIHCWDATTGRELRQLNGAKSKPDSPSVWIRQVVFSPDGDRLHSVELDDLNGTVRSWDVVTGQKRQQPQATKGSSYAVFPPTAKPSLPYLPANQEDSTR
jgi:WD40 repeat protein